MRWCRRRSRFAIEYFVVVNRPIVLLSRFGGPLNVLEDWIIRVDFVVQHQPLSGQAKRFLHGELVLLRVPCKQLVLGLVEFRLSHFQTSIKHGTCSIGHLKTNRASSTLNGFTQYRDNGWSLAVRKRLGSGHLSHAPA